MPYRATQFCAGEHYHVYNRGHSGQAVFLEPAHYLYFLHSWHRFLDGQAVEIVCYCLMPNHFHLLLHPQTDDLSRLLQPWLLSCAKTLNRWAGRSGQLFQGPFKAAHVGRNEYLLHLSRYLHLNPVVAGLVQRAEDWEWSSYRDVIGLRAGTLPHPEIVLAQLGSAADYRRFVESYVHGGDPAIAHLVLEQRGSS